MPAQTVPAADEVDDEALEAKIAAACAVARDAGRLVDAATLAKQVANGGAHERPAPAVRTQALSGAELMQRVEPSVCIVGHYYRCKECDEWHFSGASGFYVDEQGAVATCAHVVAPDDTMRQSFLVVADLRGNVWPVRKVLAAMEASDLCVLETAATQTTPLPLRPGVRTGEAVHCLSHPDHHFGFFSDGVVARRFRQRPTPVASEEGSKPGPAAAPAQSWLHVTCDFAKGSSGAPIVDACGNVVGVAQATTTVVYDEEASPIDTQMVFKIAAPASSLLTLLRDAKR